MSKYSAYWRTTILAAIIFHVLAGLALAFAVPKFIPDRLFDDDEMAWVEVDVLDDAEVIEDSVVEEIPDEDTISEFEIPEFVMPLTTPVIEEKPSPPPPPKIEIKIPKVPQKPIPEVVKPEPKEVKKVEETPAEEEVVTKPQMGQPPVTVKDYYPRKGSGLGYRGYVSIAATIGKDGTVKRTKVMRSSGRMFVDSIAEEAAKKWIFKPAMDESGKPMECDKIITFDFKKFADA